MAQLIACNTRDRNAFVRWTENYVEIEGGILCSVFVDCAGVGAIERSTETEFGEETAVDEVG